MISRLVLYTEGIETLCYFSLRMGEEFKRLGYEVFYFDLGKEYDSFLRLMEFIRPHQTACIAFNFNGCSGEQYMYDKYGIHFYDFKDVITINIVVDHPFYYHKFRDYIPDRYIQLSIDGEHEDYIRRFFPEIKRGPLLPLAGTDICDGRLPSYDERDIDVCFVGNYNPPEKHEKLIKRNGPEYELFYRELIDDFITHPHKELTSTIESHIRDSFEDVTEESLKETFPYMIMIDLYIRHYMRAEVVKGLIENGVKVCVYGAGWDELKTTHPENLIIHDNVDSRACLEVIKRSKISLNVMPWFKRGAHDRVFNSMLNGSICLTDTSLYLKAELSDGEDVIFYELDKLYELPDKVRDILSDKDRWNIIQKNAYDKAVNKHTWAHRARTIHHEILRIHCT